jgi:hypothetical protein
VSLAETDDQNPPGTKLRVTSPAVSARMKRYRAERRKAQAGLLAWRQRDAGMSVAATPPARGGRRIFVSVSTSRATKVACTHDISGLKNYFVERERPFVRRWLIVHSQVKGASDPN